MKAREAAGIFVREAVHDGMKDAARKVVVGAILATGVQGSQPSDISVMKGLDFKKKAEPPKIMKPWETTVTREPRPQSVRP